MQGAIWESGKDMNLELETLRGRWVMAAIMKAGKEADGYPQIVALAPRPLQESGSQMNADSKCQSVPGRFLIPAILWILFLIS
jgi:hypothetical protein